MSDQWEALFRIWHGRQHPVLNDSIEELEERIVKLEAYVAARRKTRASGYD